MKFNDAIWGTLFSLLGAAVLWHVQSFPPMPGQKYGPAVFPGLIAVGLLVSGFLLIARGVRSGAAALTLDDWARLPNKWLRAFTLLAVMVFYIFASTPLGFLIAGTLALFVLFLVFDVPLPRALVIALITTLVIHFLFYKVMRVPLPWGVLTPMAW